MNFNQLIYFVETVKYGSINKASRNLDINPSTLLFALSSLEEELGCSLLVRSKHGTTATKAGEDFYKDCLQILELKSRWLFYKYDKVLRKEIEVCVIPSVFHSVFDKVLFRIKKKYPELLLNIQEKNTFDIEGLISEKKFSVAVSAYLKDDMSYFYSLAESFGYSAEILGYDAYHVLLREEHPLAGEKAVTPRQLQEYPVCDSYNKTNFKFGLQNIFNLSEHHYINEKSFQIKYILHSDSFGLVPSIMKHNDVIQYNNMHLVPLDGDFCPLVFLLIYPNSEAITFSEKCIVTEVREFFRNLKK